MKPNWLLIIFTLSFFFQGVLKSHEANSLAPFFKSERAIKVSVFEKAKSSLISDADKELLYLWESMLTGRSARLSRWIKSRYKSLGLSHIFTPSGFHLSAMILPFTKVLKTRFSLIFLYLLLGLGLLFLPGLGALKRMVIIKTNQQILGFRTGFVIALIIDILWGSFQNSPLSFTYSFLFLGVIYSGKEKLNLCFWLFMAQCMLAHFQGLNISPLLILLNPLLSLIFGIALPLLFVLAVPLCQWQLTSGLFILKALQKFVDISSEVIKCVPTWEMNIAFLFIFYFLLSKKWKHLGLMILLFSGSLNIDTQRMRINNRYDLVATGAISQIKNGEMEDNLKFENIRCKRRLIRGYWLESCSPIKGSSKKTRKLSYL